MAYLVSRPAQRFEIRESRQTAAGPRSRRLARFKGPLTPEILENARRAASTPFDRAELIARALEMGIPVEESSREPEIRALLERLKREDSPSGVWVGLLEQALERVKSSSLPETLRDVSEWVGEDDHARGRALRDLLDTYSRIEASRELPRSRRGKSFPHFASTEAQAAS